MKFKIQKNFVEPVIKPFCIRIESELKRTFDALASHHNVSTLEAIKQAIEFAGTVYLKHEKGNQNLRITNFTAEHKKVIEDMATMNDISLNKAFNEILRFSLVNYENDLFVDANKMIKEVTE